MSLERLIYQHYTAPRASCCNLEQRAKGRLGTDGHNGVLVNAAQLSPKNQWNSIGIIYITRLSEVVAVRKRVAAMAD